MEAAEFKRAVMALSKEKGIDEDTIYDAMELALTSAYKKNYHSLSNVRVDINRDTGDIKIYSYRTVVFSKDYEKEDGVTEKEIILDEDGNEIEVPKEFVYDERIHITLDEARKIVPDIKIGETIEKEVTPKDFGRVAAATAKQVVIQKIREAERTLINEEFADKQDEMITGLVAMEDVRNYYIDLGRTQGILPKSEIIPGETIKMGSSIKVYITKVENNSKGPLILLSRKHYGFVKRLFELEIPEINEGIILIYSVAREAGVRTKIAVYSENPNVDPVGACIGQNGNRIQAIVSQLGNAPESKEKIDVITYKPNLGLYLEECLKPGIVIGAKIDLENSQAIVVTQNGTSSLAIGARGCNVILTKQLTKLKDIQIIDEAEAIEKNLEYTSIDEFIVEAREEEKKKYREEALKQQKLNENKVSKDNALIKEENLFTKDEFDEDELNEEPITLEETKVTETNVPKEVVETKETPKVEEEVKEEVVVKETPKKVKYEETIVPTEVKTTTTLESLEKSLEEEKEKENKKASFKSKKKKEESKNKEQTSSVKKESSKMSIYTEEELAEFDDELEDEFDDEDYSEYDSDDYYDA